MSASAIYNATWEMLYPILKIQFTLQLFLNVGEEYCSYFTRLSVDSNNFQPYNKK